jgi:hypothetical protein
MPAEFEEDRWGLLLGGDSWELAHAAERGEEIERGWSFKGWRKRKENAMAMADKPSSEPIRLTKETKAKHPDTGEPITLAAGTEPPRNDSASRRRSDAARRRPAQEGTAALGRGARPVVAVTTRAGR